MASSASSLAGRQSAFKQVLSSPTNQTNDFNVLYVQPNPATTTFGTVRNIIGGSRTIEMSLHITY
jgi:hypothetical protein